MVTKNVIGYGNAARIHKNTFPEAEMIGVFDNDSNKIKEFQASGMPFYRDLEEMLLCSPEPGYFDVTTPTDSHFGVVKEILSQYPAARILVEKPVCMPSEIEKLRTLEKKFKEAKLVVNENYMSSQVTQSIRKYVEELGMKRPSISIEFSKNRIPDVEKGRFVDKELGAFGYEGPHMLTCVNGSGGDKKIKHIWNSALRPMVLSNGNVVEDQGEALLDYRANDGSSVHFFTSMIGNTDVRLPSHDRMPEYNIKNPDERYRIMLVEKGFVAVGGIFEPIPNKPRGHSMVFIYDAGDIKKADSFDDNHMRFHQQRAVDFFEGKGENPCNVETAVGIVEDLDRAVKFAKVR